MNQLGRLDGRTVEDGRAGTLEELMEGRMFSCEGIYMKNVIEAL